MAFGQKKWIIYLCSYFQLYQACHKQRKKGFLLLGTICIILNMSQKSELYWLCKRLYDRGE